MASTCGVYMQFFWSKTGTCEGTWTGFGGAQPLGDIEHDILQASARTYDHIFQMGWIVLVLLDAIRILGHVNALHVRGRAIQFHRAR